MKNMTKVDAINAIVSESSNQYAKDVSIRRVGRACAVLGLNPSEAIEVAKSLELGTPSRLIIFGDGYNSISGDKIALTTAASISPI